MKNTKNLNVDTKTHFKMYKSGKFWVMSGMSLAMLAMGGQASLSASATEVNDSNTNKTITTSQSAQGEETGTAQTNGQSAASSASQSGSQSANTQTSTSASATPSTSISATADNATDRSNFQSSVSSTSSTAQSGTNNTNSSAASDTSVSVPLPDDIANLQDKKQAAQAANNGSYVQVSTWAAFKAAYTNNKVTYIELTGNIAVDPASANNNLALGERTASIIIDGGGFSLNIGKSALRTGQATDANGNTRDANGNRVKSTFTITDITLMQKATADNLVADSGKNGAPDAAIDAYAADGSYGGWYYNINNFTLTGVNGKDDQNQSTQPLRLLDAEGSSVVLSGTVNAYVRQEMMQIGQVSIANGAKVMMQRVAGFRNSGYSVFFFSAWRQSQSMNSQATGYSHTFSVGDGATI
ncbi:hypothetical protein FPFC_030890 [Fructobacillus pseudoficulneus]|uniref:Uncharacterized protein n=1 Tax=Fructobacillus pseudoficulneus TaxID=220714 RepID=A0A3F3H8I4_9LACO|nr:KxYKxGKxW signal peptide domain-containing protein [Fructobacillus pseudoficulneus]GAP02909.1 hypothetical protein FPFC_030890 [Fructobacillus pseudoficulneus]SEH46718.1 KxYKxGKxW signal peptide containing protein [Fructobacillus pseudoficulneus]